MKPGSDSRFAGADPFLKLDAMGNLSGGSETTDAMGNECTSVLATSYKKFAASASLAFFPPYFCQKLSSWRTCAHTHNIMVHRKANKPSYPVPSKPASLARWKHPKHSGPSLCTDFEER